MKHESGALRVLGILLVLGAVILAFWWFWGPGVGWRYMAPYRSLVARHVTQRQFVKEIGKPNQVFRTKQEFLQSLHDFSRRDTAKLWAGGPVYMDWADPWHDCEGMVVYLAFDRKGRASGTQLCGHAR